MHKTAVQLVWIAVGGAAGSTLRFVVSLGVQRLGDTFFPIGTLAVNVLGCLAIGSADGVPFRPGW